jgi:hypothetical protein
MTSPRRPGRVGIPNPSLRPRPRLFVALCAIFALWMAALLILYFLSVYPRRHPADSGVQIPSALQK